MLPDPQEDHRRPPRPTARALPHASRFRKSSSSRTRCTASASGTAADSMSISPRSWRADSALIPSNPVRHAFRNTLSGSSENSSAFQMMPFQLGEGIRIDPFPLPAMDPVIPRGELLPIDGILVQELHPFHHEDVRADRLPGPGGGTDGEPLELVRAFLVGQDVEQALLDLEDEVSRDDLLRDHAPVHQDLADLLPAALSPRLQHALQLAVGDVAGVPEHHPQEGTLLPPGLDGLDVDDPPFREVEIGRPVLAGNGEGPALPLGRDQLEDVRDAEIRYLHPASPDYLRGTMLYLNWREPNDFQLQAAPNDPEDDHGPPAPPSRSRPSSRRSAGETASPAPDRDGEDPQRQGKQDAVDHGRKRLSPPRAPRPPGRAMEHART